MKISAAEALVNATVGLLVSYLVTLFLLPVWGLTPSASASAGITATYFVVSFARGWVIREGFRRWA